MKKKKNNGIAAIIFGIAGAILGPSILKALCRGDFLDIAYEIAREKNEKRNLKPLTDGPLSDTTIDEILKRGRP